mmetsp:Transcript_84995/g.147463  ORF Transcript_84995/g.147463 Transcript_84995/m.147463 type:complete len:420 (-) Transcript_84995:90-1349(-)
MTLWQEQSRGQHGSLRPSAESPARHSPKRRSGEHRKGKEERQGERDRRDRSRSRRRRRSDKKKHKDQVPHFEWKRGMTIGCEDQENQYVVDDLLGDGTFGRVLECRDCTTGEKVAIKVVKGMRRLCEHAQCEAEVLFEIQRLDPHRRSLCVLLHETFLHGKYNFCLVFEPLAISLRDFLKANDSQGLFVSDARQMTKQLLQSLSFMHSIGLTHTDLKCRNVMLRDGRFDVKPHPRVLGAETHKLHDCRIVVIDFGGAVFKDERHDGRIGTRQFRAPEVVLGLPWDELSDIWGAGCIIAMLYLGERLFSVHEDMEHLAMMEQILGAAIPPSMALKATASSAVPDGLVFEADGKLAWPRCAPSKDAIARVQELLPLCERVCRRHWSFLSLLQGLLEMDPARRLSAAAAAERPFLIEDAPEE